MDCQIALIELNLTDCAVKLHNRLLLDQGGYLKIETNVQNSKPEFNTEEKTASVESKLSIKVDGRLDADESEEDASSDVFHVNIEFTAIFSISEDDGKKFAADDDFRKSLAERFANRIYPALRNHANEVLGLIGVGNAQLPWHLSLE